MPALRDSFFSKPRVNVWGQTVSHRSGCLSPCRTRPYRNTEQPVTCSQLSRKRRQNKGRADLWVLRANEKFQSKLKRREKEGWSFDRSMIYQS